MNKLIIAAVAAFITFSASAEVQSDTATKDKQFAEAVKVLGDAPLTPIKKAKAVKPAKKAVKVPVKSKASLVIAPAK